MKKYHASQVEINVDNIERKEIENMIEIEKRERIEGTTVIMKETETMIKAETMRIETGIEKNQTGIDITIMKETMIEIKIEIEKVNTKNKEEERKKCKTRRILIMKLEEKLN